MDRAKEAKVIADLDGANLRVVIAGLGTKKGNRAYQNWRADKLDELEKIKEKDLNIFERLKRNRGRKARTLFDKLKYFRKGK